MFGSKLTKWWHDFVDGLPVSPEVKASLHAYGPYAIWAGIVGLGVLLVWMVVLR